MRKTSRVAAVFAAAAFLISALVPAIVLADAPPTPSYAISAKAPAGTIVPGASSGYTQVAVGTPVTLTAAPTGGNGDQSGSSGENGDQSGSSGENGDQSGSKVDTEGAQSSADTPTGRAVTNYEWSAGSNSEGAGLPQTASGSLLNEITVTPTKAGTYKYTVTVTDGSEQKPPESDTRSTLSADFQLTVVGKMPDETVSADAGETKSLKASWGEHTAYPASLTYTWKKVTESAPDPTSATGESVSIAIPGTAANGTKYEYTVTPSGPANSDYTYAASTITVTVSNTFTASSNDAVTWYRGSTTPPSLTATFSSALKSAEWKPGSLTTEEAWNASDASSGAGTQSGSSSTYTVPADIANNWPAGTPQTYTCMGTSATGAVAFGLATVSVAAPAAPAVTGSAAVSVNGQSETYATGAGTCTLDAVVSSPPVLTVEATGGTGGISNPGTAGGSTGSDSSSGSGAPQADPYTYAWYTTGSDYVQSNDATSIGSSKALSLSGQGLQAGQTTYYICVVTVNGNSAATATQRFAVTAIAQAIPAAAGSSQEEIKPVQAVDTDLTEPITLKVTWNPPVAPSGVRYTWTVASAPSGGQITLETADGTGAYIQSSIVPANNASSIKVTRFSTAGTYVVTCSPQTSSASRTVEPTAVEFKMIAGAPSVPSTTYWATQNTTGDVALTPTTAVSGDSVSVDVNSRLALYIPPNAVNNGTGSFKTEWVLKRSAADSPESLPSGAGFYGAQDNTLVTGPVTAQMNGWQFSMKISSANASDDPALSVQSPWITLRVNGSAPSTTPAVTLSSTPAAQGSNVPVAAGANVTFTANVTNTNSIPTANLSYQWYTQASTQGAIAQAIEGATASTYTISSVAASQNGQSYWCVVSNSGHMNEQGTSTRLTLSVNSQPGAVVITEPTGPSLTNLSTGKPLTFVAQAHTTNGSGVTYKWHMRKSANQVPTGTAVTTIEQAQQYLGAAVSSAVPEGNSATLTVASLDPGVYEYTCLVTNSANTAQSLYSAPYYVAVTQHSTKPVVTVPTQSITYVGGRAGEALYLECQAYLPTDDTPTYQWQAATSSMGPWSDLGTYTESELRIPSLSDQNNGSYYRCMVTNPATKEETPSYAYQVSVWNPNDTPTVTGNPQSVTYTINTSSTGGTAADNTVPLESTATSANTAGLSAQWEYRTSGGTWSVVSAANGTTVSTSNGTSRLTLPANAKAQAPNGEYRCVWMYGNQAPNQPLVPQSPSLPAVVEIILPGRARITTQPVGAAVHVGSTASFTVGADLGGQGTLVYVWQTSSDRGQTWRNCTSATDGSGQFTATFQTYPVTEQMYEMLAAASPGNLENSIYQYRCIVANRAYSETAVSEAVPLTILPGASSTPTITPGSSSTIEIVGNGGAKYTKGLKVSASGTTASAFLKDLGYTVPAGYTMELRTHEGQEVPSSAIVCTGMRLVLIQTVSEETVDTVNIVVMGDVMGTGQMSLSQLVSLARAFRGKDTLSGPYYQAALLTGRDTIQLSDLVAEAALYKDVTSSAAPSGTASPAPSASAEASASTEPSATATASPSSAR